MPDPRLFVRLDLANGSQIGPGKIALLEAIRDAGSISAAARALGMSYRRAWMLVSDVNLTLREPAVRAAHGGKSGGGASVTPVGDQIIRLYRAIEARAKTSAGRECRAIGKLARARKARA